MMTEMQLVQVYEGLYFSCISKVFPVIICFKALLKELHCPLDIAGNSSKMSNTFPFNCSLKFPKIHFISFVLYVISFPNTSL